MTPFAAILVPLDGSATAAQSLGCACWLASRLDAALHVLSVSDDAHPTAARFAERDVPEACRPRIVAHQVPGVPERAILEAVERYQVKLVLMTARGVSSEAPDPKAELSDAGEAVGHVARAVMEHSPAPVLLLPSAYREQLPWQRMLVPVSGESYTDDALELAVRLARQLELQVTVAHVADAQSGAGLAAAAHYADAAHHEYPRQLEQFVRRALPEAPPEEHRAVKEVVLCQGDISAELLGLIERKDVHLLVIGWRGSFMTGNARVLRQLVHDSRCPLLLVKPATREPFKLKVGEQLS